MSGSRSIHSVAEFFNFLFLFAAAVCCLTVSTPTHAGAITLPVDQYLEGDPSIIPFFPVGTIEITDVAANIVRFDLTPITFLKFDNLGLGLDPSIDEDDLVLTALTADQMSLDTGGWLGFPFKINFDDKPMTPVSFQLSAPGLDLSDFFVSPASKKFPNTIFALRFWYMIENDIIDTTAGGNTPIPEPATVILLGGGLLALTNRKLRRAGRSS